MTTITNVQQQNKRKKGKSNDDKAKLMIGKLVAAFEAGNIAQPMATMFLLRDVTMPMQTWSYLNRLFCVLSCATDARGFQQWKKVGRKVSKGEKAHTFIRIPCKTSKEQDEDGEDKPQKTYFRWLPLFDVSQTEGEPLEYDQHSRDFIESLPLIDVAHNWGLSVNPTAHTGMFNGFYQHGTQIALAVENRSTWLHELIHAAEDRRGALTKGQGQQWDNEVVAILGACVLAHLIGEADEADEGKAFRGIKSYAEGAGKSISAACAEMAERTAAAVELILNEKKT